MPVKIVALAERFIFESSARSFHVFVIVLLLAKTGIWWMPNVANSAALAVDPFANPFSSPQDEYLIWTWLGSFIAHLLGTTSPLAFIALHLGFSIAFWLVVALMMRELPSRVARTSMVIFVATPVSGAVWYWVGPDSLTLLLLAAVFATARFRPMTLVIGVALGMQHFEQSLVAAGIALLTGFLAARDSARWSQVTLAALLTGGVVGGRLLLTFILDLNGLDPSTRAEATGAGILTYVSQFVFHFQIVVWSVLGVGWFVVLRACESMRRSAPLLVGLALALAVTAAVGDQTRVFAVVTFPLLAREWFFNREFLQKVTRAQASLLFLAWVIVPYTWVWEGHPRWSVLPFDIAMLVSAFMGRIQAFPGISVWPFVY